METMQMEKVKKLVPELRFKRFEGEFEYKKLGDVSNVIMGQSPDSKSYNENGEGYYLIQGNADIKNRISSPRQWTNMPTKTCEIGDVILTVRAPVGAVAKSLHNACIGRGVCVIRNLEKYDLEYIYQFLLDFETKWGKLEQGSTFTAVSGAEIKSIKIVLPSLPEQQKIASFLSAVDEKIQQLTRKKELLEQYKKGLMQQLFSAKLRFKDEDGKDYSDWEEKILNDVILFVNGKGHEQSIDENGEFVVVNSKFVSTNGRVRKFCNTQISPLSKGEMVMVMSDVPNGKALAKCYLIEKDNFYTLNQRICGLKAKTGNLNDFLIYLLNRNKYYLSFDSGVGQTNLKKDEVLGCPLFVPSSFSEQQKIANFLSSIDAKIESTIQQLTQTQTFKKGLLQKMFV